MSPVLRRLVLSAPFLAGALGPAGAALAQEPAPEAQPAPYVDDSLRDAIDLRGAVRAIIRLKDEGAAPEGGAPTGIGRFGAAAAAAARELGAQNRLEAIGPDLRVAEITAAQLDSLLASGAVAEIHMDRLTSVAFDRVAAALGLRKAEPPAATPPPPAPPTPPPTPGAAIPQPSGAPAGAETAAPTTPAKPPEPAKPEPPKPEPPKPEPPKPEPPKPNPPPEPEMTPSGPAVAVIDTGVDENHPYIRGAVVRQACFSSTVAADRASTLCPNRRDAQTIGPAARPCDPAKMGALCGHGTMVAGLIAGRPMEAAGLGETPRKIEGVAPGTPIIAVQVFSRIDDPLICASFGAKAPCPLSYLSDQIAALRFLSTIAEEYDLAAVNMSLSSAAAGDPCDSGFDGRQFLSEISYLIERMGVLTVAASGNEGQVGQVGMPACVSRAVAVAAVDAAGEAETGFSNVSASIDLLAPGVDIVSSTIGEKPFAADEGTSFATPQVSAAIARVKAVNPGMGPERVLRLLQTTGAQVANPVAHLSFARLDLQASLARMMTASAAQAAGSPLAAAASARVRSPLGAPPPPPAVLPPAAAPAAAPSVLSPGLSEALRPPPQPSFVPQAQTAARPESGLALDDLLPPGPPLAPPPPPVAPIVAAAAPVAAPEPEPSPAAYAPRGSHSRFLFELDPLVMARAREDHAAGADAETLRTSLKRLIEQATPVETSINDLQIDVESGQGRVAFSDQLDSRQIAALEAGFPGRLIADRLAAPKSAPPRKTAP